MKPSSASPAIELKYEALLGQLRLALDAGQVLATVMWSTSIVPREKREEWAITCLLLLLV